MRRLELRANTSRAKPTTRSKWLERRRRSRPEQRHTTRDRPDASTHVRGVGARARIRAFIRVPKTGYGVF